jgi:hypothetical protein
VDAGCLPFRVRVARAIPMRASSLPLAKAGRNRIRWMERADSMSAASHPTHATGYADGT